jgi:2',3'-cyclic-nucleotide 2'-phosphodiesterase (5'-nucleotidase family)
MKLKLDKQLPKRFYTLTSVPVLCATLALSSFAPILSAKTTLVYTSNQPDILLKKEVAHFPQLGTLLKKLRKDQSNTLFLHGGDSFSPSAISLFDKARNIISLANLMDVSLYSVGKRELSYDVDVLSLRALDAQFPIITSNITDNRSEEGIEGLFSHYQFDIDGQSIFISSIVNPRTLITYAPKFANIKPLEHVLRVIEKQQQNADVSILMTDLKRESALALAAEHNFDLMLVAIDGKDEIIKVGDTTVVLAGGQDGDAAVIDIDNGQITAKIENLTNYEADAEIVEFVNKYQQRLGSLYNEKIAIAGTDFTTKKAIIRTRETALANVFTDALREFAKTDIAILNSGSIRNSVTYPQGYNFTRGDIQREFPFGGFYVVIEISGKELKAMMENAVSRIENIDGRFLNVSGLTAEYNSKHQVGNRLKSLKFAGKGVEDGKFYTLAMQDFYLKGGDDYTMLKTKQPINNLFSKSRIWNIVADYFSQHKIINKPAMNRLIDQANE